MELLNSILENSQIPLLSAFILGLMTAISPCPLATNITAIGFISKDIENRRKVFINGLVYTLGRGISYFAIGLVFFFGASQFEIAGWLQEWGEKLLGPLMILIGVFMLGLIKLNIPGLSSLNEKVGEKAKNSYWGVLLLGILFALAFCPYSGVLYFGLLIPMTISSASGLYLPLIFAIATGIPVIIFAWLIAFSVGSLGSFYKNIKIFETWFRRVVAVIFIAIGIYYSIILLF
ncbi:MULTISPECIES: aromatic aminobenezylarsenical efflux permease ArsG family transporter [unclassified Lentimicrobium]|uniref:aromatic aminobenezylarsenical efflux permease ArsG family transporter n=1 Tax=unclassified Lentimicrobium TaxID=2677434 RepID=UPI0015581673|nr:MULTISPECIES: aromatic aminobenezylarsenical efflux permease ArsG family transporter [unclassified Lentimicrobium]NPD47432.1 sulfite exporter TauE/SafE family protein [Lentimicrobium sp. S6]NPD85082.1 sulfite exporter TauE/SafE family protein [Lentimicrobium sp. L6]